MDYPAGNDSSFNRRRLAYLFGAGAVCALGLILVALPGGFFYRVLPADDFVLFHLIFELIGVIISFAIFTTGWYGNKQRPNAHIFAIAAVFFTVGLIDFFHTLSYNGMPAVLSQNSLNKTATYWIATRLITAVGLLAVAFIPETRMPRWLWPRGVLILASAFVALLVLIEGRAPGLLPAMYAKDTGLTTVNNVLDYIVIVIYLGTIAIFWRRHAFEPESTIFLQTALLIAAFGEFAYTRYLNELDSYSILGHVYKVAAYYFILRAVFVSSLQQPYRELDHARDDLESSLNRIGEALASSLELDRTLELIVDLASDMLYSSYAFVALMDAEEDMLVVRAVRGLKGTRGKIPIRDNLAEQVIAGRKPVCIADITATDGSSIPAQQPGRTLRAAVAAPILKGSAVLGLLAVYSEKPAAFQKPQASLLAAFARQAAVAISNAQLYENELDSRTKLLHYATRLSLLHQIGLSLNRETNQHKLLETVLRGAVELTSSGAGLLLLVKAGKTEIASIFHPDWYGERCTVGQDPSTLHTGIGRLMRDAGDREVLRLAELGTLQPLPPGHLHLRGLMVATIRDFRGGVRGYFMLTDKAGGLDFTEDDEEVIALLAAQCSVALTSAENFEREHYVAETLQEALLPEKPARDDIEVGLLYRSAAHFAKVGGDFYDFIELDGNRIAIAVGDVCGKGLEAATYIAMIKYMLRAYLGEGLFPGDCLSRLNNAVYKQVSADKFITMGLAIIDTGKDIITYASAGHPPPFICREGKAHAVQTPHAVPLGVLASHTFLSSQIPLAGACAIIMYTDGLIEARPPDGEPFGENRVAEAVAGNCCREAQLVADQLVEAALEYSGGNLRDDIALLVVRLLSTGKEGDAGSTG
ncbi:MAG: SpoIIE family protein phosphatase [Actinomycetota bacterium]|jgi:serine phosphatase RsbU (regulator of sigma subunit)/putative methionine-R-sulfoxide reductase with GAF domain|nr:SpoIIE family protein phosphatase [Actinomycetota bacterium]MCL6093738.1 SpoIIE family protein phosphatase [Actinomycetota bacterium]MDA8167786.1 SpoIIE family protein phosphatase [Actinomycetota bacterium]